jgi:hypothetical protein
MEIFKDKKQIRKPTLLQLRFMMRQCNLSPHIDFDEFKARHATPQNCFSSSRPFFEIEPDENNLINGKEHQEEAEEKNLSNFFFVFFSLCFAF